MRMFVKTSAQAQSFWASVEIAQGEINEALQKEWEENVRPGLRNMTNSKGRPLSKADAEAQMGLYELYQNFWRRVMWEGIEKQNLDRRVCFLDEVEALKEGDRYAVRGVFFWEPVVTPKGDGITLGKPAIDFLLEALDEIDITHPDDVSSRDVHEEIADIRSNIMYNLKTMTPIEDGKPLEYGDVCIIQTLNNMQRDLGSTEPQKTVVVLGSKCPEHIRDVLIGKAVGDDIIMSESFRDDDGETRNLQVRAKVLQKCEVPEVPDEAICAHLNCKTIQEVNQTIKIRINRREAETFSERFHMTLMKNVSIGPVPSYLVWDRAEGMFDWAVDKSEMDEDEWCARHGYPEGRDEAVHALGAPSREAIVQEIICREVASHIGIRVTRDEAEEYVSNLKMDASDPQVLYTAQINLYAGLVLEHYGKKAQKEKSRIIIPGRPNPKSSGLIVVPS